MNTAAFSIKDAIGFGWAMVKEKFWFLTALVFISGFFAFMPDMVRNSTDNATELFLTQVISIVFGFVIDAGLIYVMLRLYDGKVTKVKDVFSQYPIAFRYFAANVLYGLMVFAGLLLLIVPGIYLMLQYQLYKYFLVDKRTGIIESFKESAKITEGKKWQLLRFALALICINILGLLFFIVGLVITIPLSMLATAYVYRKLSTPITEPEPIKEPTIILEPLDQSASIDEKIAETV